MTIAEKIASKKTELAEKRSLLKAKISETRDAVGADDSTLSADDITAIQKQITVLEQDCQKCAADLDALENINPLLQDPNEPEGTDDDMDETDADPTKQAAADAAKDEPVKGDTTQSAAPNASAQATPAAKTNGVIVDASNKASSRINNFKFGRETRNMEISDLRKLENSRSFANYVKSRGETRDTGIMSTDPGFGAIVPVEYLQALEQKMPPNSLAPIVHKVAVNYRTGHLPLIKRQTVGMTEAAQLAANNITANPTVEDIIYDIKTYRQQLNIAEEMVDDSNEDVTGLVADFLVKQKQLTEQYQIGKLMFQGDTANPVTPVAISASKATAGYSLEIADQIKHAFNVDLNIAYTNRYFVATQTCFQILDTLKDNYGRYLVQSSLIDPSQKTLFGAPLIVIQDIATGANGNSMLWLGEPDSYALYAHRNEANARFLANWNYELQLYCFFRADFKVLDPEAGITMTLALTA